MTPKCLRMGMFWFEELENILKFSIFPLCFILFCYCIICQGYIFEGSVAEIICCPSVLCDTVQFSYWSFFSSLFFLCKHDIFLFPNLLHVWFPILLQRNSKCKCLLMINRTTRWQYYNLQHAELPLRIWWESLVQHSTEVEKVVDQELKDFRDTAWSIMWLEDVGCFF